MTSATVFLNLKGAGWRHGTFWFRLKITEKSLLKWKEKLWILFLALWLKWASQNLMYSRGPKEGRKGWGGLRIKEVSGEAVKGPVQLNKCVSPWRGLPSSKMPVRQTELEVAPAARLGCLGDAGAWRGNPSRSTLSLLQRRQWGGAGWVGSGWQGWTELIPQAGPQGLQAHSSKGCT